MEPSSPVSKFFANGVFGSLNYLVDFTASSSGAFIIVGPNGTGKSTILSLYYLFITRQWSRLAKFDFLSLSLELADKSLISLNYQDLFFAKEHPSVSISFNKFLPALRDTEFFNLIGMGKSISSLQLKKIASRSGVPEGALRELASIYKSEMGSLNQAILSIDQQLNQVDVGSVLYLPTFRRIEKNISLSEPGNEAPFPNDQQIRFIELVKSGMRDVSDLLKQYISNINAQSRIKTARATQEFIRGMLQGKVNDFSMSNLKDQDDSSIEAFVASLQNELFSDNDKQILRDFAKKEQIRGVGKPKKADQYMGYFFSTMFNAFKETQKLEAPVHRFVKIVSSYFHPWKAVTYNSIDIIVSDAKTQGRELSLEDLSSGEKQIFAVFAYLLFSNVSKFTVLIDEPELSLSVPWQKTFLTDIISTGRCTQLFAVTHSPFIFDNELDSAVFDIDALISNVK